MFPSRRAGEAVLSGDTSREAEQIQVRVWRSMSPADKAGQIVGAWRAARLLAFAGLRERHPHAGPAELVGRLADITLGCPLARRVYASVDMRTARSSGDDLIQITLIVIGALEQYGIPYTVGVSLASSFAGEPRSSIDADIVIDMRPAQVEAFVGLLGDEFYADADALRRAITAGSSTNLVHRPTGIKVDLFAASSLLDAQQLARRRRVRIGSAPDRFIFVHSPEDILLQKLHWYRSGGEVSDRQWRDALSIILVQAERLDHKYLSTLAARVELEALVARAFNAAGGRAS